MKKCKRIMLACVLVGFGLMGCATVTEKIAEGVTTYCFQPLAYRLIYRNTVNAGLAGTGHNVHVHCAGDPDDLVQPEIERL